MPRTRLVDGVRINFTAEEEAARDAEEKAWSDKAFDRALADLRAKRNRLLQESDWEILSVLEKGTAISTDWKNYRQALRDLPDGKDTVAKCENATWPTKP